MPLTIGTAGHIDHGKTWLVRALTGKDTDRLPEEQERGISIDLGYAPLDLPDGRRLSLIDVPGHERFVRTMVAGASGIDLFLLVIDAGEGARPQTHEHLAVLRLLGVARGVVAVTKADAVDEETLALAMDEARELVPGADVVPVSAKTGAGLDELRAALARAAESLQHSDTRQTGRRPSSRRARRARRSRPERAGARRTDRRRRRRTARRGRAAGNRAAPPPSRRRARLARRFCAQLSPRRRGGRARADSRARARPPRHRRGACARRSRRPLRTAATRGAFAGREGRPDRPARGDDRRRRRGARPGAAAARGRGALRAGGTRRTTRVRTRAGRGGMGLLGRVAGRASGGHRAAPRRGRPTRSGCFPAARAVGRRRHPQARSRAPRREAVPARRCGHARPARA
ncbi:MAG: hypothetical protein E6G32_14555 [Actinobacteria bacterium]|nr:MAG: hypothetical protein E6G32_14555 [Actinomycetota bacterium]